MKTPSEPMDITPNIAAKCDGPDQFSTFDRLVRNVLAIPPKPNHANGNRHPTKQRRTKR